MTTERDKAIAEATAKACGMDLHSLEIDAIIASVPGSAPGYCELGDRCNCGGDLPRVREGCSNWAKGKT